jgi:hypothetical protein
MAKVHRFPAKPTGPGSQLSGEQSCQSDLSYHVAKIGSGWAWEVRFCGVLLNSGTAPSMVRARALALAASIDLAPDFH